MRVTMLVRCLAMMRGGGETRHLAWMRELTALGVDVDVIAGQPLVLGGARHPLEGTEIKATIIRSPYMRDAVYRWQNTRGFGRLTMAALHADEEWFCRAAWRRIAARPVQPDVVHAHALHQAARLRQGTAAVVINLPGAPPARYAADVNRADALVADGWAADHLPAMLGSPVVRVPKGVDTALFTPEGSDRRRALGLDSRRVVVSVGRLVPIKNVRLILDAIHLVREREPRVHLLHVGEGPDLAMLKRHASVLGIADAVTFAGYVPQCDTPSFYRTGDLFALTSDFDNSPNVVLEAMACGLPIVSTDVGGVRELVDADGRELAPPRDAGAVASALLGFLSVPARAESAGHANRRAAVERFSWRASAQKLLDVYRGISTTRARPARAS
jgi:glycosyltransferase involved in cell wall biosynthesis